MLKVKSLKPRDRDENTDQRGDFKRREVTQGSTRVSPSLNDFVFEIKENFFQYLSANGLVALGRTCKSLKNEINESNKKKLLDLYRSDNFYEPFIDRFPNFFRFNLNDSVLFYFYSLNNLDRPECCHFKKVFEYWLDHIIYSWISTGFQIECSETKPRLYLIQKLKTSSRESSEFQLDTRISSYLLYYDLKLVCNRIFELNILYSADLFIFCKLIEVYFLSQKIIDDFQSEDKKPIILDLIDLIFRKRSRNDFYQMILKIINHFKLKTSINTANQIYLEFEKRGLIKFGFQKYCSIDPDDLLIRSWAENKYKIGLSNEGYIFFTRKGNVVCDEEDERLLKWIRNYFLSDQFLFDCCNGELEELGEIIIRFINFIAKNKDKKEFSELISDILFHLGQKCFQNTSYNLDGFIIIMLYLEEKQLISKDKVFIFSDYIIRFFKGELKKILFQYLNHNFNLLMERVRVVVNSINLLFGFLLNNLVILNKNEVEILLDLIQLLKLPLLQDDRHFILKFFNFCISSEIIFKIEDDAMQVLKNNALSVIINENFTLLNINKSIAFSLLANLLEKNPSLLDLREALLLNKCVSQCLDDPQCPSFLNIPIFNIFLHFLERNDLNLDNEQIQFLKNYAISIIKNSQTLSCLEMSTIRLLRKILLNNLIVFEETDLKILKDFLFLKIWFQDCGQSLLLIKLTMMTFLLSKQLLRSEEVDWQELKESIDQKLSSSEISLFFCNEALLVLSFKPDIEHSELFSYASLKFFRGIYEDITSISKETKDYMLEKYPIFLQHPEPMVRYYAGEIIRVIESFNL